MEVHQAIRIKRAVRSFDPGRLPTEAVQAILNAGRRARREVGPAEGDFKGHGARDHRARRIGAGRGGDQG